VKYRIEVKDVKAYWKLLHELEAWRIHADKYKQYYYGSINIIYTSDNNVVDVARETFINSSDSIEIKMAY